MLSYIIFFVGSLILYIFAELGIDNYFLLYQDKKERLILKVTIRLIYAIIVLALIANIFFR
jgi:hypothetical protein